MSKDEKCNTPERKKEEKISTSTSTSIVSRENVLAKVECNTKPIITSLMLFGRKISLYIKPEEQATWLQFKELAKMERMKVSHLAEVAISEYVYRHQPGNPQLALTRFVGKPKQICSLPGCQQTATFIDVTTEGEFPVCVQCHERHVKVGILKGWRKI